MSRTRGSFGSHARTFRAIFITAALLACGESSSNPVGPPGGNNGGVAQISITPTAPTVTLGAQLALQAQVRDANGGLITGATVFWSSADTTVATISSSGVVTGKGIGSAQVAASSGGQSARAVVTVTSAPVASVSVLPAAATLVVGGTTVLRAVTYDANQQVLTGRSVVWASSATQVASIDATGNVIGVAAGTTMVTATSEGKTASATITVTVIPIAAIAIAPGSAALTVGQSTSLTAIATDANGNVLGGRPMKWKSADPTIADVSALGLVTAIAPGTTTVSATAEGKTGVAQVVVTSTTPIPVASVAVNPTSATLIVGGTTTISATLRDANGATLSGRTIAWTSSAPSIATVSSSGDVTAVAIGTATITATCEGKSGATAITVSAVPVASISVTPPNASLLVGGSTALTAVTKDASGNVLVGRTITWTSSAPSVASVSPAGVVTGVAAGNATITATSEGKSTDTPVSVALAPVATITLTPTSASLVVGNATTIAVVLKDANGDVLTGRTIAWSSSVPGVATVDANGVVTAVSAGTATIAATSEGKTANATITVSLIAVASVTTNPTSANLLVGGTLAVSAIAKDANGNVLAGRVVAWSTNAPSVATVNASTGLVTAVGAGNVTITATSEGKTGTTAITVSAVPVASISVTPPSASLLVGGSTALTAVTKDASGNVLAGRTVTWTSSAPSVASVSPAGVVTGVAAGNATITATSEGKSTDTPVSVALTPVATITLTPTSASLVVGNATAIAAVLKDANGNVLASRTITWSSSVPGVATVDANGVVTAVSAGTATITATSEGKTANATITVSLIPVASVTTSPTSANLLVGGTQAMSAITKDANGNVLAGRVVAWSTNAPLVATVNPNTGLVTAVDSGTATVTATSEGKTGSASIVVALVPVATVTVNPSAATIIKGGTQSLTVTLKDDNNNTLTGRAVLWTTSRPSVAGVNAAGLVSAVDTGTATVTATAEGKSGSATITVIPVPVASVTVRPLSISLPQGATTRFVATPEDSNNQPLRYRVVSWTSSAPSLAAVSATRVDSNFVTAIKGGSATITATSEGKTGTATIIVTDTVAAVVVTPSPVSLPRYKTVNLSATTNADDGTPLGRAVTWSSNPTSVATVDASGVVTAVDVGPATITATSEGKQGFANITITQAAVDTVRIDGPIPSLTVGGTTTVTATTTDQKGVTLPGRTITWTSAAPSIATVDPSTGLITAIAAGTANITATSETKTSAPAVVTVTNVPVATVDVTPANPSLSAAISQTVTLTATPKDAGGHTLSLSGRTLTWSSGTPSVATVAPSTGVVTAVAQGTATITATVDGVPGSTVVTVNP